MTRIIFILALLLLSTSCGLLYDEQKTMQEAEVAQKAGNFNSAIISYKKVLQHNANNQKARVFLAQTYLATGQGAVAEKELKHAIALGVPEGQLLVMLAKSMLLQNDYDRLLNEIRLEASISERQYNEIIVLRAKAFLGKGEFDEAQKIFEKILASNAKNIDALAALALIEQRSGRYRDAEAKLDKALALDDKRYDILLQKAQLLQVLNQKDNAIRIYENVLVVAEKTRRAKLEFQCRTQLANLFLQSADYQKAKQQLDVLIKKANKQPYVWYLQGAYDYQLKNYDDARIEFEKVLSVAPNHEPTLLFLGATQYASKNYEQANEYLTRFVNAEPTHVQARKLLGMTRMHLQLPEKAYEVIKSGIDKYVSDANDVDMLRLAGKAALQSRNNSMAINYLKKSIEKSPHNNLIRKELAQAYLQEGDFDKAITTLSGITGKDELSAKSFIIQSYLKRKDYNKARIAIKQILSEHPRKAEAFYIAAIAENIMGNRSIAYQYLRDAETIQNDYVPGLLLLARLHIEDGEYTQASDLYNKVLALDGKNIQAMIGFAHLEEKRGKTARAIQWLENARKTDANAYLPRFLLVQYYLGIKKFDDAISIAKETTTTSDNIASHRLLAKVYLISGKIAEGTSEYKLLAEKLPNNENVQIEWASLNVRLGKRDTAIAILKNLLKKSSHAIRAYLMLANLEIANGNFISAQKLAQTLSENKETKFVSYLILGDISRGQKKYSQAISNYKKSNELMPSDRTVLLLAKSYQESKQYKLGIQVLKDWINKGHRNAVIEGQLGTLYQEGGYTKRAISVYTNILKQQPKNLIALNNLAVILMETDINKALEYAQQAYQISNKHLAVIDTLGWIWYQKGDFQKALHYLEVSGSKSHDPSMQYHLATTLVKTGDIAQAKNVLQKIKMVDTPSFPEAEEAKALLERLN